MKLTKNFSLIGFVTAAIALPISFFAALLSELLLKQNNPRNIDITADIAYLGNSLWVGFGMFIFLMVSALILSLIGLRTSRPRVAQLSLVVIAVISVLSVANFLLQKKIETIESNYAKRSIQDIFAPMREQLKKNKSTE